MNFINLFYKPKQIDIELENEIIHLFTRKNINLEESKMFDIGSCYKLRKDSP